MKEKKKRLSSIQDENVSYPFVFDYFNYYRSFINVLEMTRKEPCWFRSYTQGNENNRKKPSNLLLGKDQIRAAKVLNLKF